MQIPVRIKNPTISSEQAAPKSPNSQKANSAADAPKRKISTYVWVLTSLAIIEAGAIIFLFLTRPALPYQGLIEADSISTTYFNQTSLSQWASSLKKKGYNWLPFASFNQSIGGFFDQTGLKISEVAPLFEDQMALILPAGKNSSLPPVWLLLATKKSSGGEFGTALAAAEKKLKQNFDLTSEIYRQIDITSIKPLSQKTNNLYFAAPKNLFLLSNDTETIKSTIDKVLK